jgi:RND family efflux transporter MFP subunit
VGEAEAELELERGRQALARREYELLGRELAAADRDRVLRAPQWAQAQAVLDAQRAALERANLDVGRTRITAPFDALVRTRDVEPGAQVSTTARLTHLVGIDTFWIEVVLPLERVRWLRFPGDDEDQGSTVVVADPSSWGEGRTRQGRVLRLLGDLESGGRMARLLVEVEDPLGLYGKADTPRLLLGAYVRVRIEGREVHGAIALDAELVRDGHRAWVIGRDGKLEIRDLAIELRDGGRVLVRSGLVDGDRVIATNLSTPVEGMALEARPEGEARASSAEDAPESASGEESGAGAPAQERDR